MIKNTSLITACLLGLFFSPFANAGNPDRQGEAGAYELLLNPWARSAGLNGLITARTTGVEALFFNPAGLARTRTSTEIMASHSLYLVGTGMSINAVGMSQKLNENGTFGVTLMSVGFGEIPLTTTNQPEGLSTFKPRFFNIGLSYGHIFRDVVTKREKVAVGLTARVVSESIANASASAVSFDAGVQYYAGKTNEVKFGISLKNFGSKMRYKGEGLTYIGTAPNGTTASTIQQRTTAAELPTQLNMGISYDFLLGKDSIGNAAQRLTLVGNFTANSFSRDQMGLGFEYAFKEMFMVRAGYKYENKMYDNTVNGSASTGLTMGATIETPIAKGSQRRIGFDYAFEYTRIFKGTHSLGLKFSL
jgi:hypothetical protein